MLNSSKYYFFWLFDVQEVFTVFNGYFKSSLPETEIFIFFQSKLNIKKFKFDLKLTVYKTFKSLISFASPIANSWKL